MKNAGSLKNYFIAEFLICLLVLGGLYVQGLRFKDILILFFIRIGLMVVAVKKYIVPLNKFEKVLKKALDNQIDEDDLKKLSGSIPYIQQLTEIISHYTSKSIRKSSVQMFNKQTELTALQSQINPHFLYNTLESIRGQALMDDNDEIAGMVEALGSFFRYSISKKGSLVTLREELANINNYMKIQRYRFNNRFRMEIIIEEKDKNAYDFYIPRLIIQPVVENSIVHGLQDCLENGNVIIEIIVTEVNLIITISDNGKGIEKEKLSKLNEHIRSQDLHMEEKHTGNQRNTGIALSNIHKRIQLLFGEEYGVNVYSTLGLGTDVEITIPVKT